MLPSVSTIGNLNHSLSNEILRGQMTENIFCRFEIIRFILSCLSIVDHITRDNRNTEEHCLDKRGIRTACTVTMHVNSGI